MNKKILILLGILFVLGLNLEVYADNNATVPRKGKVYRINENGQEVEPGEVGELVIRGSNVMQGYWNDPEETARIFRPGKYRGETLLYSGDLFKKDEDGFLYFIARKDDLIKTK